MIDLVPSPLRPQKFMHFCFHLSLPLLVQLLGQSITFDSDSDSNSDVADACMSKPLNLPIRKP